MKNLLLAAMSTSVIGLTGCSTMQQNTGSTYRESNLENPNPAPKVLTPPDYALGKDGQPIVMDEAYMKAQADYHFTMGETLSYEGQSPRAVEEFKTTLVYDAKSVAVRLRLAAEYVRLGMITEAVEQGEAAVQMAPDDIDSRMLLGGLYSGLKMFDQARAQFGEVLKAHPGHAEAAVYMGALLAEQKKYDESIRYFEALAKNKNFKETEKAHYYIGRVRTEQGPEFSAAAEQSFNKALAFKPEYPEAVIALATMYMTQGKNDKMETLLRSYQEKFGADHEMARTLAHYYLEKENFEAALEQLEAVDSFERDNLNIKIQIALIMIEQKKYEQAATRLEDILQQAPDSDKVRYYLGAVYEEIKQFDLAREHYAKIAPSSNYFSDATVHTAQILRDAGHVDKALEYVESAIRKQDDLPQLYAFDATLLDEKKDYKSAVTMLTGAVEKFPSNTQLRFFLGTMNDRVGDTPGTIAEMQKVLDIDKDHVQALNYLAYTYADHGQNLGVALALANHALHLQPGDGYILDTLGWIHFKKGEVEEAIKFLEAAHKAKADEAIIAEHLGDAYLRFQMWQKAQKMYQRAASLEQDQQQSRKIMEKIANIQEQTRGSSRRPASE